MQKLPPHGLNYDPSMFESTPAASVEEIKAQRSLRPVPISATEFCKLVDDFGNAALKAGQTNSGHIIDVGGPMLWKEMQKLRVKLHVLILRLDLSKLADPPEGGIL